MKTHFPARLWPQPVCGKGDVLRAQQLRINILPNSEPWLEEILLVVG